MNWGSRFLCALTLAAIVWRPAPSSLLAADGPPPLPLHTLEGYGGCALTPMAYLVNGDEKVEGVFSKPSAAISFADLNSKSVTAVSITETLFGRVELGYSGIHCSLGSLPSAIHNATGIDPRASESWLHNFNVRWLAVKENEYELLGVGLPAVTAGIHFKYNDTVSALNRRLGGTLSTIGFNRPNGEDYTLTASKTFPNVFGRAMVASAGLRLSQAAQLGLLGFGNTHRASFEGNVVYFLCDRLLVAYEFRQKHDPYSRIPGLIDGEDHWQDICVALVLNKHSTLATGWGQFGTVCNEEAPGVWLIQMKHEF